VDLDPRGAERSRDCLRYVFVFARQNSRTRLKELDAGAEGVEYRGDLRPRCPRTHDDHRRWHSVEAPGIAVRMRQLDARNRQSPTYPARAKDDLSSLDPQSAFRLDSVRVNKACDANLFVNSHSEGIDLLTPGRVGSDIACNLAHPTQQASEV